MFINHLFPIRMALYGASGGPNFVTSVVRVSSRNEFRDQTSGVGLGRWTVSQNAKLTDAFDELNDFFWVVGGRINTFPFKDFRDFKVTVDQGILVATGVTNQYQLYKRYSLSSDDQGSPTDIFFRDRKIRLPVVGQITINGGTGVSIDYETGLVTSSSAPTSWFGQFNCLCRFDIDDMDSEIVDKHARGDEFIISWGPIPILEVDS